ncbi:MAG: FHA domain-containing protein [Thermoleophilia bacterium]
MSETGLIIAEVVFLVLLYAFVWAIVRSASRQMRLTQSAPPAAAAAQAEPAPVARATPPAAPPPVEEPPTEGTAEPLFTVPPPEPADIEDVDDVEDDGLSDSQRLDLAANLDPRLVVEQSPTLPPGREIPLEGGLTIGRSGGSGVSISDQFVSHMHARIMRRGPYYFVEDLGSTNGTFLNDRRIERDAQLKMRDHLRIGQTIFRYEE